MPLLQRKRVLGAAVETAEGTAEVLTATDAVVIVYDPAIVANIEMQRRPRQGSFGEHPAVAGPSLGRATFRLDLGGSEVSATPTPDWADILLLACGMAKTAATAATNISAATAANPCVVTVASETGIAVGDWVYVAGIVGTMGTEVLNGKVFRVTVVDAVLHKITLDVSTTGKTYTSGGTVTRPAYFQVDSTPPEASGAATKTLTLGTWEDGRFFSIYGAMGSLRINAPTGRIVGVDFSFEGIYATPAADDLVVPTWPTVVPPRFAGKLELGGVAVRTATLTLDLGNELVVREDANAPTGYCSTIVADRLVAGSMDPEAEVDMLQVTDWLSGAADTFCAQIGSTLGNIVLLAGPAAQRINVQPGDRGKISVDQIDFQLNPSADAGDDEFRVYFL